MYFGHLRNDAVRVGNAKPALWAGSCGAKRHITEECTLLGPHRQVDRADHVGGLSLFRSGWH